MSGATLATLSDRVKAFLHDTASLIATASLEEAFRQALREYDAACPLIVETVFDLPGDGREVALDSLADLVSVKEVWFPFDSLAVDETFPPNEVKGFRLMWDDARPVLYLDLNGGRKPLEGEEIRIWYRKSHTIENLDGGDNTSMYSGAHETLLVLGAVGYYYFGRIAALDGSSGFAAGSTPDYSKLAETFLSAFRISLSGAGGLSKSPEFKGGTTLPEGHAFDRWDGRENF